MLPLLRDPCRPVPPDQQLLVALVIHQTVKQAGHRMFVLRETQSASPDSIPVQHTFTLLFGAHPANTLIVIALMTRITQEQLPTSCGIAVAKVFLDWEGAAIANHTLLLLIRVDPPAWYRPCG